MIKAIIWDFDGVIVDSVSKNQLSFKMMFEKYGKEYNFEYLVHTTLKNVVNVFNTSSQDNYKKTKSE